MTEVDREVERLMDLVGALVQANVAQVQHCTKHKAFSEELGTQQRAAYIAVQDELERLVADARRWSVVLGCVRLGQHGEWVVHEDDPHNADGTKAMFTQAIDAAISANPLAEPKETGSV